MIAGKKHICYIDVSDFTDIMSIGNDPVYKRYNSVYAVVKENIDENYQSFLAEPEYEIDKDQISWYIDDCGDTSFMRYTDLQGDEKERYVQILNQTIEHYRERIKQANVDDKKILSDSIKFVNEEFVYCANDKVFLAVWGMMPDEYIHKSKGTILYEVGCDIKHLISFDAGESGILSEGPQRPITIIEGKSVPKSLIPKVIPNKGYEFIDWEPSVSDFKISQPTTFVAQYKKTEPSIVSCKVKFVSGQQGNIIGIEEFEVESGTILSKEEIPVVEQKDEYIFKGWDKNVFEPIITDTTFYAEYENQYINLFFNAGDKGELNGYKNIKIKKGETLKPDDIPIINSKKGFEFECWTPSPMGVVNQDTTFIAQYKEIKIPWWRKTWIFLTSKGCLRWLLWLLLLLLLLFIGYFLMKSCFNARENTTSEGNGRVIERPIENEGGRNLPITDGVGEEPPVNEVDNGIVEPITGSDGVLPPNEMRIIAPITGRDGRPAPILDGPNGSRIISNRLFLFLEDDNADIGIFARDFKNKYPEDRYSIISFDREAKFIVIQVPENEREIIANQLNSKLPNHRFIVIDEQAYGLRSHGNGDDRYKGWHIKAINLEKGWQITKGSRDIKVAVIDDGIEDHPIFEDRIESAYNLFRQDNKLNVGVGHGTHTAGLAVGSERFIQDGVAGVAPNCTLIPVQVFDKNVATLSTIVGGIMYAIHKDADVVNISLGPVLRSLSGLSERDQKRIAETMFKKEELLWKRIFNIAKRKKTVLVFAAGNDNILSKIIPNNRSEIAIVVGAVDRNLKKTSFTNYGEGTDISAPGEDIYSSFPYRNFKSQNGTSMAAPIVAGTIALMKSINRDITTEQIISILRETGKTIDDKLPPMVQVDRALQKMISENGSNKNEEIRRLIQEYRNKIQELEKQLNNE